MQVYVPTVRFMVTKDGNNVHPCDVPEYERELLEKIWGEDNVQLTKTKPGNCIIDPDNEADRLTRKYGMFGEQSLVEAVFGASPKRKLRDAVMAVQVGEHEPDQKIVLEGPGSGVRQPDELVYEDEAPAPTPAKAKAEAKAK